MGLGGATITESSKRVNGAYSFVAGTGKSALIAANFVDAVYRATPNLIL